VFAADRALDDAERAALLAELDRFLDVWAAHKVPLPAARELRYDQFVLIGVDESSTGASGCSIDALVREMKHLEQQFQITLVDHGPVLFRDAGVVRRVSRDEFRELAERGRVTADTVVFDNTQTSVGALMEGKWETRAAEAWHGRAFGLPTLGQTLSG
jgi:hypothetical protein